MQALEQMQLRILQLRDESAFREALKESSDPDFDFALFRLKSESFQDYLRRLDDRTQGIGLPAHQVADQVHFAFLSQSTESQPIIVGRLSFRAKLNEDLLKIGGHLGYGVLPKYRQRGFATRILAQGLVIARREGLFRVLVTCRSNNLPSRKTIEACGGVLEDIVRDPDSPEFQEFRYWIDLAR
ncbi:MAG: GNAT family N-acetyltransferase [Methylotenera sp.]|nr:GNAT family N-acetyltransferase [Oligoflexia bacterium]